MNATSRRRDAYNEKNGYLPGPAQTLKKAFPKHPRRKRFARSNVYGDLGPWNANVGVCFHLYERGYGFPKVEMMSWNEYRKGVSWIGLLAGVFLGISVHTYYSSHSNDDVSIGLTFIPVVFIGAALGYFLMRGLVRVVCPDKALPRRNPFVVAGASDLLDLPMYRHRENR
jgi:hypothetical protein